ncbi:Imm42 family immunity protein [Chitinophaga sp. HK235]|uniref:Imm42 family immunity protein n=1 Tax=Chitinophaga sp. HK235 TaxID=2952571 RepID=UPI001BAD8675|nr:Imm42 family immunity protein [Chitinophaga sp. HK235]
MVFGQENIFTIDADLSQSGYYTFINCCFRVKEVTIGDITQLSLLGVAQPLFKKILLKEGQRSAAALEKNSADEIIHLLKEAKSGDNEAAEALLETLEIDLNGIECFDGYYFFLIESQGFDRLLISDNVDKKNYEFKLPKNHFYKSIKLLLSWINDVTYIALKTDM